jgi:hypothetical protein
MRDVVWTLIVIWLIYRLYTIFFISGKQRHPNSDRGNPTATNQKGQPEQRFERASKKLADNEGEYVSYEEVKD